MNLAATRQVRIVHVLYEALLYCRCEKIEYVILELHILYNYYYYYYYFNPIGMNLPTGEAVQLLVFKLLGDTGRSF